MSCELITSLLKIFNFCMNCENCKTCPMKDICGKCPSDWI